MADNGISSVSGSVSNPIREVSRARQVQEQARTQQTQQTGTTQKAQSQTDQRPRQTINIEGRTFDANAPRGTYLNILA